jgi:hypothetical protein
MLNLIENNPDDPGGAGQGSPGHRGPVKVHSKAGKK